MNQGFCAGKPAGTTELKETATPEEDRSDWFMDYLV